MSKVELGKTVPNFSLPSSTGETFKLKDFRGHNVILFFYPRNMTPTCTTEVCHFRDHYIHIHDANAIVVGISTDNIASHKRFIEKYQLPYPLLSDEKHKVSEMFGVWKKKELFGHEHFGIERSTFLIDKKGKLRKEWRKVKIKDHVEQVVEELNKL